MINSELPFCRNFANMNPTNELNDAEQRLRRKAARDYTAKYLAMLQAAEDGMEQKVEEIVEQKIKAMMDKNKGQK